MSRPVTFTRSPTQHATRNTAHTRRLLLLFLLLTLLTAGCARRSQQAANSDLQIEWAAPLQPALAADTALKFRLSDAEGAPVDDATLHVKGDMTHAGMVPVLAESEGGEAGVYTVPFQWTMAGDWIITVRAELPDGAIAQRRFQRTVFGEDTTCGEERNKKDEGRRTNDE